MSQIAIDFTAPTLQQAREQRDIGMHLVGDKAEREEPGFAERAYAFLEAYAATHSEFSGEDCTDAAKVSGIVPHDDRAFGPIYMRAIRADVIYRIGYTPRRKGHGSPGPVYGQRPCF